MPHVVFFNADGSPSSLPQVDAPEGGAVGDLCDEVGANIPFSCRSASCGTCRVMVLEGADLLLPPDAEELNLLDVFAPATGAPSPQTCRLACQAKLYARPGRVVLRPVADDEA